MNKVSPQIDEARLTARWNAAKKVADEANEAGILALAEQALNLSSAATETVRVSARLADTTYVSEDDALELSALAAGALASLMTTNSRKGETAAASVRAGLFGRSSSKGMTQDLRRLADAAIQRISEEDRKDAVVPTWAGKAITDVTGKQAVVVDLSTTHTLVLDAAQATINSVKAQFQKFTDALSKMSSLQKESSDLAYLLVSQYSFVAGKVISSMSASDAAFCSSRDLFNATQFTSTLPAFEASLAMLLRPAKLSKKAVTLSQAVSGLDGEIRQAIISNSVVFPKILPLHFAVLKCQEVSGGETWAPAFETVTGLKSSLSQTPEELAAQFYLESILIWHLEG
nr:GTPase-associated system all-helical protein GASH [Acidisarcina polymorpha]